MVIPAGTGPAARQRPGPVHVTRRTGSPAGDGLAILRAMSERLAVRDRAPNFTLKDQTGRDVRLSDFKGRKLLVYFYPKADTPGCTTQACGLRDILGQVGDAGVVGISPDPPSRQAKFDQKYGLGFPLLSDEDHAVAEAYGVWALKSNYGRTYMGIERSAFLVDGKGKLEGVWYKISPKDTPRVLLESVQAGAGH